MQASSQLTAHSSQLTAHSSQLTAHSSQPTAHSSHSSKTTATCHRHTPHATTRHSQPRRNSPIRWGQLLASTGHTQHERRVLFSRTASAEDGGHDTTRNSDGEHHITEGITTGTARSRVGNYVHGLAPCYRICRPRCRQWRSSPRCHESAGAPCHPAHVYPVYPVWTETAAQSRTAAVHQRLRVAHQPVPAGRGPGRDHRQWHCRCHRHLQHRSPQPYGRCAARGCSDRWVAVVTTGCCPGRCALACRPSEPVNWAGAK